MKHTYSAPAVAVIGMAGRFPAAKDLESFWRNLADGIESLDILSDSELSAAGVPRELLENPSYVKKCTFLEDADRFDAGFFGLSAREAEILDPQHRVFLECAWAALEDAGYVGETHPGPIGVFAGAAMNTYLPLHLLSNPAAIDDIGFFQTMIANDKDFLSTRVSYKLNLRGPSVVVQTACSTSLVAVEFAWQRLLNGECDIALAGGVAIGFPQRTGYLFSEGMIFSPDGHCRPFDAQAQGIRAGAGAGIVVLKRLSDAIRDRDNIRAVIRGAAINNDGAGKVGYTAPSVDGQAEAIAMAQARARIDPDTIDYIEAHGTATPIGDPIEIAALTQAFRLSTSRCQFCAIGSIKANIGHLDTAAGVAGLIKTVLALEHKQLPPSLNYRSPNPQIPFETSPFYVNHSLSEWRATDHPRRAGVSSFGIGGTNAHVVLEESPVVEASHSLRPAQLLILSARTASALNEAAVNLSRHLVDHPEIELADAAYTLHVGRKRFAHRRFVVCRDRESAISGLQSRSSTAGVDGARNTSHPSAAFMFSGQGSQYTGMAKGLYDHELAFREHLDHCAELLVPHLGLDLRMLVFSSPESAPSQAARLNETSFAQPALFSVEYALAKMWMHWGIQPSVMIGHSIGEYVAACLAGVFSLEDALNLVAARGRLMQRMPAGRMLAVQAAPDKLVGMLSGGLSLAAVNGPASCTVSGPADAIAELEGNLALGGIETTVLHTSHAFHSTMMEPILPEFAAIVGETRRTAPVIPYISNLSGRLIDPEEVTKPEYWSRHLRDTVNFAEGVRAVLNFPGEILLEVGPGQTLCTFARQVAGHNGRPVAASLRHPHDPQSDVEFLLNTLGKLWTAGFDVDWAKFHEGERLGRVSLPSYPFERKVYWLESGNQPRAAEPRVNRGELLKKSDVSEWFYVPSWKRTPTPVALGHSDAPAGSRWLVFMDECGLGVRIVEDLRAAGCPAVTVELGTAFHAEGDCYTICASRREDYQLLFKSLRERSCIPTRILHLWNVTTVDSPEVIEQQLDRAFYSLLHLIEAADGIGEVSEAISLTAVSNHTQSVIGDETIRPVKATLVGPCIIVDNATVRCRTVDIGWDSGEIPNDLVRNLVGEAAGSISGIRVAYRGHERWVQTYESVRLGAPQTLPLRPGGVYLITGGTGGLGLVFARFLAETTSAKLVLSSRSSFPLRAEWDHWLIEHDSVDTISYQIQKILEIEALGSEVLVTTADVADRGAMESVVTDATRRFGAIHGVIHAAGLLGDPADRSRQAMDRVLRAKVSGTLILDSLFKNARLDWFVLCSSISAIVGVIGTPEYVSANAFLDAFAAARRNAKGTHAISINWDFWEEIGMAAKLAGKRTVSAQQGAASQGILPLEGADAFRRILPLSLSNVAVITRDLPEILERQTQALSQSRQGSQRSGIERQSIRAQHQRPSLSTKFAAFEDEQQRGISEIWEELLGMENIGIDDNFFELGGHSLLATGLLARIHKRMQVKLSLRTIFEAPTIRELALRVQTIQWATSPPTASSEPREEFEL